MVYGVFSWFYHSHYGGGNVMKKEIIVGGWCLAIAIIVISALFSNQNLEDVGKDALRQIRIFNARKQGAFTNQGFYPPLRNNIVPGTFPLLQEQVLPQLIKELGIEVLSMSGGKVKISGVMGNSWAEKGGLRRGDIILRFNKKSINGFNHFKSLIADVRPEKKYRIRILRGGRVKSLRVTVGEGEMEGFNPIVPAAFSRPYLFGQGVPFVCPQCGYSWKEGNYPGQYTYCPRCGKVIRRR